MFGLCDDIRVLKTPRRGALAACAMLTLAFAPGIGAQPLPPPPATQQSATQPPAVAAPPAEAAPAPAPSEPTGALGPIQKFFEDGAANFRTHLQGAKSKFDELGESAANSRKDFDARAAAAGKGAAEATKSAVESVAKLPAARVAQGRERCELASNGAPDCQTAADNLCRKQGFAGGKSIDFTSAEECSARTFLSGRQSGSDCRTVTFISRAMCQ